MQSIEQFRSIPVMRPGQSQPFLGDIATVTTPKVPGELDRYNGQFELNVTANLHNLPSGESARSHPAGDSKGWRSAARR